MTTLDECLTFLRTHGADELGHGHQSLLDHLLGTSGLLRE